MYKTFKFESDSITSAGFCNTIEVGIALKLVSDEVRGEVEYIHDITENKPRSMQDFDAKEQLYITDKADEIADRFDKEFRSEVEEV